MADIIRYDHYDLASFSSGEDVWNEGPVVLVRTRFHGGGIVSRHRTVRAAYRALKTFQRGDSCSCGCVGIIAEADYDCLPTVQEARAAYVLARIAR